MSEKIMSEDTLGMLRGLVMTKTETEKLLDIFRLKCIRVISGVDKDWSACHRKWKNYLRGIEGIEYVGKLSDYSDQLDDMLESINSRTGERFVIRDPHERSNFIIIEKELARTILVLGALP